MVAQLQLCQNLMISNLISSLLGLQVIFGVTNGHLSLHFTVGVDYYSYLLFKSNTLNIIHTGDNIARGLGVRLSRERLILFFIAVMLSSAAVAVAGSISFIGLMGPHIAKRIVGPRHQLFYQLPF